MANESCIFLILAGYGVTGSHTALKMLRFIASGSESRYPDFAPLKWGIFYMELMHMKKLFFIPILILLFLFLTMRIAY